MRPLNLCPTTTPQALDCGTDETRTANLRSAQPPDREETSDVARFGAPRRSCYCHQATFTQRLDNIQGPSVPLEVPRQDRVGNISKQPWARRQLRVLVPMREAILEHVQFAWVITKIESVRFSLLYGLSAWHFQELELLRSVSQRDTVAFVSEAVTIYALSDPRKPELIRYIGKTHLSLARRLMQHFQYAKRKITPKNSWLVSLQRAGLKCLIWPLEVCQKESWEEREKFWIRLFRPLSGLLNLTDGGNTGPDMTGYRHSEETRRIISESGRGKPRTEKQMEAIRKWATGRKWTAEQRLKYRLAKLGKPFSELHRANHAKAMAALAGKKRPIEVTEKMLATKIRNGTLHKPPPTAGQNARPVCCVETSEIFPSILIATKAKGFCSTAIHQALKLGTRAGKYHWRYA